MKLRKFIIAGMLAAMPAAPAFATPTPYFTFSTNSNVANVGGSKELDATFLVGSNGTLSLDTSSGSAPTYGGSTVTVTSFSGSSSGNDISTLSFQFTYNGATYVLSNNVAGISMDLTPGSGNTVSIYSKTSGGSWHGGTSSATLAYYGAAPEIDGGLLPGAVFVFGTFVLGFALRPDRATSGGSVRPKIALA